MCLLAGLFKVLWTNLHEILINGRFSIYISFESNWDLNLDLGMQYRAKLDIFGKASQMHRKICETSLCCSH